MPDFDVIPGTTMKPCARCAGTGADARAFECVCQTCFGAGAYRVRSDNGQRYPDIRRCSGCGDRALADMMAYDPFRGHQCEGCETLATRQYAAHMMGGGLEARD
jgi:DnaJ-class molecular chaperone